MKIHIIIDHPDPASFNHQIMNTFIEGIDKNKHELDVLDLDADQFNPVMSKEEFKAYNRGEYLDPKVKEYQQRLKSADYLALFFPIWWMVMPARMKGWIDKVLLPGFAFSKGANPEPLLSHITSAVIFTTTAISDEKHRKDFNNALDWVLCKGTLNFIGIRNTQWLNFGEAGIASPEKYQEWLAHVLDFAKNL
ncbi:MAG TPA: NAD(P)H-dependent oxidoreductase [Anaerolineaceae bacterium]|nr:NAD(P)H-dependent oxidoreductase [Anaerolineaceae bacterium]